MSESRSPLPTGERVGNYQILGVLGAGGMGVVYKALDLKLERTVALKFLSPEVSLAEREKERLLREARAASALDHTNIGVIHGLENTADGQLFMVMAYYEGKTLAQKMREGPLSTEQAAHLAMQMAQGLAAAHARNIVHRDIKPSNAILTNENVLKIVDFGLAQVVSMATVTQSFGVAGTVPYMSPEQTSGLPVDHRSDIWSLGVVLAEMVTGRHPFQRDTLPSVMHAILEEPPQCVEGAPVELQRIVYRALAKDPANRYQSCREMAADLERLKKSADTSPTVTLQPEEIGTYVKQASSSAASVRLAKKRRRQIVGAAAVLAVAAGTLFFVPAVRQRMGAALSAGGEKHIAILPFDNIGDNPANEALAQGLMESMTSKLSNLDVGQQSLWVVPTSVVRQKKANDPSTALRELGATLVVKGSIERDDQGVRLTVNLIDTKTLRQVGSVALENRTGDLATLQNEAVARLARLMQIAVTPEMLRDTGGSVMPAAYEAYLKALGYMERYDKPGNLDLAVGALEGAVKADPRFALGFASACEAYRLKYSVDQNPRWVDEASANCRRAVELDDRLPAAYVTLGRMHSSLGKDDLALQQFNKALSLNPRDPTAVMGLGSAYERMGRAAEAESTYQRAAALRPDYWDGYNSLALFYIRQRRYPEAEVQLRRVIDLTPDNAQAYSNLGVVYWNMEKLKEAEGAFKKSIELAPGYASYANLGGLFYIQKRYGESAAMTEKALQLNDKDFRLWANLAIAYKWLNERDKARAASEKELARLEEIVKLQPQNATVQSALGLRLAERNQRDKALSRMQAALALAPNEPAILANAGETHELLGDRKQALIYLQKAFAKGYTLEDLKGNPDLQSLLSDPNLRPPVK